ncbi:MAG: translation initiation factor IF-2 N-terminal domain-containing protein [Pirellulaceae bacterium]
MAVRIYALAKDVQVDSKDLVEICKKIGIQGKGSALASLDDDEVEKVKAYLSGGNKPAAAEKSPAAPAAPHRPGTPIRPSAPARPAGPIRQIRTAGPLRSLTSGSGGPSAPPAEPPEEAPPVEIQEPAAAAPEAPPEPPAPPAKGPEREDDSRGAYRREDYIRVGGSQRVRVIGQRGGEGKEKQGEAPETIKAKKKPRAPVIKLASMPDAKQPTPAAAPNEPAPQKPEIRLPKDAIRRDSEGQRPNLAEHMAQAELEHAQAQKPPASPTDKKKERAAPADGGGKSKGKRRGGEKEEADDDRPRRLVGMASARLDRQKARRTKGSSMGRDDDQGGPGLRRRTLVRARKGTNTAAPRKGKVALELPCTVRSFSEATGVPSSQVQRTLMQLGTMATINQQIDDELVELLAVEVGVEVEIKAQSRLRFAAVRNSQAADGPDQPLARVRRWCSWATSITAKHRCWTTSSAPK